MEVWMIFVGAGLVMVLLELVAGVDTELDLAFVGTAFILGGLIGMPFESWVVPLLVAGVISVAYMALGRTYVHRWTAVRKSKTNVDAIAGRTGVVIEDISTRAYGRVRVGAEDWRARSSEDIQKGEDVVVVGVDGVTLVVEKPKKVEEK